MTEALAAAELEIPRRLAAALAYGIVSETENLGREAGPRDVQAYRELIQKADPRILAKIQTPQRPKSFFEVLGRAIRNAFVHKTVIGVHLGPVPHPDRVSQVADFLLTLEKMRWSICTGRYEGRLHVSVRARNPKAHAGRLLRRLLNGSGGGHSMVAGGAVEMPGDTTEERWSWKEEELTLGFLSRTGHREPFELTYPFRGD
jgi:nanoRNase/pAp phosphatase (c-di-AMP/oligoRNAs hydrolase)